VAAVAAVTVNSLLLSCVIPLTPVMYTNIAIGQAMADGGDDYGLVFVARVIGRSDL